MNVDLIKHNCAGLVEKALKDCLNEAGGGRDWLTIVFFFVVGIAAFFISARYAYKRQQNQQIN